MREVHDEALPTLTARWDDARAWAVPGAYEHLVDAGARRWRVSVGEPPRRGADAVPVVYVLDPLGTYGITLHVARTLHLLSGGAFPDLLVVGFGPDTDDPAELMSMRQTDLSPGDGGDATLDLLSHVVAPYVEERYGGDAADRTIAGWSLGGLLGAHALVARPGSFRRYLLVSPSLWWSGGEVLGRVAGTAPRDTVDVYVAVGGLEEGDDDESQAAAMVTNARALAAAVADAHTTVTLDVIPGEGHTTVWPAAVSRGLRRLHATS